MELEIGREYRRAKVRNTANKVIGYRVVGIFNDPAYSGPRVRYAPFYEDGTDAVTQTCGEAYFRSIIAK